MNKFTGQFYECAWSVPEGWVYRAKQANAPDHDDDMVLWSDVLEWLDKEQLANDRRDERQVAKISQLRKELLDQRTVLDALLAAVNSMRPIEQSAHRCKCGINLERARCAKCQPLEKEKS